MAKTSTPAAVRTFASIPAHPQHPQQETTPPCGGSWVRNPDGSLTPADDSTAAAAGLLDTQQDAPQDAPQD